MAIQNTVVPHNRFVIPDVHGCYKTLKALIKQIKFNKTDVIYFLGDYIDRGPNSKNVIDFIIDLKSKHEVYCLKGNHEAMYDEGKSDPYQLKKSDGTFLPEYQTFWNNLKYYIELDDTILVHAGINFNKSKPFKDFDTMVNRASKSMYTKNYTNKRIIRGHSRKDFDTIKKSIEGKYRIIALDNGCYKNTSGFKHLCCLELNTFRIYTQKYCD